MSTRELCAQCAFAREIASARGSTFVLCRLSEADPAFPKYPRLPVLACTGFAPVPPDSGGDC